MSLIKLGEYYSYDNLTSDCKKLYAEYPSILQYTVIGKTLDQREIHMLKVGAGDKNIICCGGVHGRESVNPAVLMKIIETYCLGIIHNTSFERFNIKELFTEYSICFIPLLNPDGYMIALNGFDAIQNGLMKAYNKSLNIPYEEWKYNARAMDINRNFPSITWKGNFEEDYPASENETRALVNIFERVPSIGFLDYHSRGDTIYYHRGTMSPTYNQKQLELAQHLIQATNYTLVPPDEELDHGEVGGNTVHYYSEYIGNPAITIETLPDEAMFPLDYTLQQQVFDRIILTPLVFMTNL